MIGRSHGKLRRSLYGARPSTPWLQSITAHLVQTNDIVEIRSDEVRCDERYKRSLGVVYSITGDGAGYLDILNDLSGTFLTGNQTQQNDLDRLKLHGVDKGVGAEIEVG